jgi:hypothetical protein
MGSSRGSLITWGVATLAMVAAMAGTLHATIGVVPEIDGASMATGLGLLSGAVLILRAGIRRK